MQLLDLPNELLSLIADFLDHEYCINAFHQSCTRLHSLLSEALYRRDILSGTQSALKWASIHGFETTFRYALAAGMSPTAPCHVATTSSETDGREILKPIFVLACECGHESILRFMIEKSFHAGHGSNRWAKFEEGRLLSIGDIDVTSLMNLAIPGGHTSILKVLVEYGAMPDVREFTGGYIGTDSLYLAGKRGHLSIVKFVEDLKSYPTCFRTDLTQCFRAASEMGQIEVVRYILDKGIIDPLGCTYSYRNPIIGAAENGHLDVVKLQISNRNAESKNAQAIILNACEVAAKGRHYAVCGYLRGYLDIAEIIIAGNPRRRVYKSLFNISAKCGWVYVLQQLLDNGCSPDMHLDSSVHHGEQGTWTALTLAIKRGVLEMIELLLNHDADLNEPPGGLYSPIKVAAVHGDIRIVEKLLRHGADPVCKRAVEKRTFFFDDVQSPEIIGLLLDWGADPNFKVTSRGGAGGILANALINGNVALVKMLLARNIALLPQGNPPCGRYGKTQTGRAIEKSTLFTYAAEGGASMLAFLLEQGYTVCPGGSEVSMALDSALFRADAALVSLLCTRNLLGSLALRPHYERIFATIGEKENGIKNVANIMDMLLANRFEIRKDLQHARWRREFSRSRAENTAYIRGGEIIYPDSYTDSDMHATYKMLLDRGANPLAGRGRETELSSAAQDGHREIVQMILERLDDFGLSQQELMSKLSFAEKVPPSNRFRRWSDARHPEVEEPNRQGIVRDLHRAYWRTVYRFPNKVSLH